MILDLVLDLNLDLDLDLRLMPVLASDWSQDRPQESLTLRYTGLEGLLAASINLSLDRPRIG